MKEKIKAAARWFYAGLSLLLVVCIATQFYWAGMAVFADGSYWSTHVQFIHIFGLNLPFVMLLIAFVAANRRWAYWHLLLLMLFTFLMYFSANMGAAAAWLGALHPVIGTLLLAVSVSNLLQAIKQLRPGSLPGKKQG